MAAINEDSDLGQTGMAYASRAVTLGKTYCRIRGVLRAGSFSFVFLVAALAMVAGCRSHDSETITSQMWRDSGINSHLAPAARPNIRVFQRGDCADVLVVYDEARDGNLVGQRAYFVRQDGDRVDGGKAQHFVSPGLASTMQLLPVTKPEPDASSSKWVHVPTQGGYFTLLSGDTSLGNFTLPSYFKRNNLKRLLLTPLTLAVDMTIPTDSDSDSSGDSKSGASDNKGHSTGAAGSTFSRHAP